MSRSQIGVVIPEATLPQQLGIQGKGSLVKRHLSQITEIVGNFEHDVIFLGLSNT